MTQALDVVFRQAKFRKSNRYSDTFGEAIVAADIETVAGVSWTTAYLHRGSWWWGPMDAVSDSLNRHLNNEWERELATLILTDTPHG